MTPSLSPGTDGAHIDSRRPLLEPALKASGHRAKVAGQRPEGYRGARAAAYDVEIL